MLTIYEALRKSDFWNSTMLVVTFDEHGGFFDHVPLPRTVPTGDDHRYADSDMLLSFDRLGVRVPALVISLFTARGTIIGAVGNALCFDHSPIPATVEKRFNLEPLTERDAQASTLDVTVNLEIPRDDALTDLPDPAFGSAPLPAALPWHSPPQPETTPRYRTTSGRFWPWRWPATWRSQTLASIQICAPSMKTSLRRSRRGITSRA